MMSGLALSNFSLAQTCILSAFGDGVAEYYSAVRGRDWGHEGNEITREPPA